MQEFPINRKTEQELSRLTTLVNLNKIDAVDVKIGTCLMARDYKGFGNQSMNGVIDITNINYH